MWIETLIVSVLSAILLMCIVVIVQSLINSIKDVWNKDKTNSKDTSE